MSAKLRKTTALTKAHRQGELEWAPPAVKRSKDIITITVITSGNTSNKYPSNKRTVILSRLIVNASIT